MKYFHAVLAGALILSVFATSGARAETPMKSMRVDASYLYGLAPDATSLAELVAGDAATMGVNTIFFFAYNPVYGASYPTTYPDTTVENGWGAENLLAAMLASAHKRGIAVVAWLPVNNFQKAWTDHADWRSKKKDGTDYRPFADTYPLSAWHPNYRSWYQGFLNDLLNRYPTLDGIEAAEGTVDFNWNGAADYNPVANQLFFQRYPAGKLGSAQWRQFRANGLTGLHGIMASAAHARAKRAYVVQTWTARSDGSLMTSADISNGCGFDFDGILNAASRPDVIIAEMMYQQWRDTYGTAVFTPQWTATAAASFVQLVAGRATPAVHVELSNFGGGAPTLGDFDTALGDALHHSSGADFYDYHQIKSEGGLSGVSSVFH